MNEKHSPGLAKVDEQFPTQLLLPNNRGCKVSYGHDTDDTDVANARRFVACWNAPGPLSTAEIEAGAITDMMRFVAYILGALDNYKKKVDALPEGIPDVQPDAKGTD